MLKLLSFYLMHAVLVAQSKHVELHLCELGDITFPFSKQVCSLGDEGLIVILSLVHRLDLLLDVELHVGDSFT